MDEVIENKLSSARTRLILDKPFLGALVLRLPLVEADPSWCKSTATDMKKLYVNPQYIQQLTVEETQFALAHEALHCALSHFARRLHRVKHRWDMACDYAINPILIEEGLKPPPHTLYLREYFGMTAEEIYPTLIDNENDASNELGQNNDQGNSEQGEQSDQGEAKDTENQKLDREQQEDGERGKGQTGEGKESEQGSGDSLQKEPPPTPNNDEIQSLTTQWQQRLAGAAQQALQAGKLSQSMARLVDHLLQPQLPWRMLLARYMSATAREDYSYTRPSSRRGEPAIYPRLRSHMVSIVVALDISGSIATREIREFLSEVDQIKAQVRAHIVLHACDTQVSDEGPWQFEPWDELKLPVKLTGGGGTRFTPVFDWVEKQEMRPDLLVYFTDAEGEFPEQEAQYPVIWLVKGKAPVPWGQRIQLN
ncbi:MAG: VWA-like domain-containing protein [Gammaproteobacteria bacterium]|nr:VWA-like domain-containing protein [Gammaproteobacteria bacterium]